MQETEDYDIKNLNKLDLNALRHDNCTRLHAWVVRHAKDEEHCQK